MTEPVPPVVPPEAAPARVIPRFTYKQEWSRRWSGAAVASFVIAAVMTVMLLVFKTVGTVFVFSGDDHDLEAGQLGAVLFFLIAPAALAVVFGHVGIHHTWGGKMRGWVLAGVGLGAAYVHVLLWGNRVINATIATVYDENLPNFMFNIFWWA